MSTRHRPCWISSQRVRHQSFASPFRYIVAIETLVSSESGLVARKYCSMSNRKFSSSLASLAPPYPWGSGALKFCGGATRVLPPPAFSILVSIATFAVSSATTSCKCCTESLVSSDSRSTRASTLSILDSASSCELSTPTSLCWPW